MNGVRFFICNHCSNLVEVIHDARVPMMCCGQKMTELIPNTVDASGEKHLPVASVENDVLKVSVGSVAHPMLAEHSIQWVYLETEHGGQRKDLTPSDAPEVSFALSNDKPVAVYAYCNLHGLWKTEL